MTAVSPASTDAASLLEDNYATLQSLLSVGDRETEVEPVITSVLEPQQGRQKDKAAIHFTNEEGDLAGEQENGGRHVPGHTCQHGDPVKMLLNRPKRSSLKKSSLIQPVLAGEGRDPSTIDEVSAADECGQEMQILPNFFDNRRKSCYSWRLRHQHRDKVDIAGREAGAGAGSGSFSCESQVFEIIHLDENNEQVSSRDKMITGGLIVATLVAVCYLFWAQNHKMLPD